MGSRTKSVTLNRPPADETLTLKDQDHGHEEKGEEEEGGEEVLMRTDAGL